MPIGTLRLEMRREGLLDLNEAVQNPGKILSFDVQTELSQEEDLDLVAPVTGSLSAVSTGNILLLEGEFQTTIVVECARCAGPLEYPFSFTMDDEFDIEGVPSCYGSDGYATVKADEPYPLFDKNALMLDTYIRQGLLVNVPFQPLCQFGWEGACPNAKILPTSIPTVDGHPAMRALEKFRKGDG